PDPLSRTNPLEVQTSRQAFEQLLVAVLVPTGDGQEPGGMSLGDLGPGLQQSNETLFGMNSSKIEEDFALAQRTAERVFWRTGYRLGVKQGQINTIGNDANGIG